MSSLSPTTPTSFLGAAAADAAAAAIRPFVIHNNTGATLLKNGDTERARRSFTNALREAQARVRQLQEPTTTMTMTSSSVSSGTTHCDTTSSSSEEEFLSRLYANPNSDLQQQAFSIDFPLLNNNENGNNRTSMCCDDGEDEMNLAYAVIIYNIGLSYHIKGSSSECCAGPEATSVLSLAKAVQLYDKSLQQIQLGRSHGCIVPTRNPISDLLYLTLLKQMADIHGSFFSDHDRARSYGRDLASFILTILSCGQQVDYYNNGSVTDLMRAQFGSFLIYAISLGHGLLLAPAA